MGLTANKFKRPKSTALKGASMQKRKNKKQSLKRKLIKSAGKGPGTIKPSFSEQDILGIGKMLNKLLKKHKPSGKISA